MTIGYNPRIVTDGLVLCLDSANTKSYPGSGTVWTDLSGLGNHGTLVNGPSYADGIMSFDGLDDYVNCGSSASLNPTTAITVSAWMKFTTITSNNRVFSDWHQAGGGGDRWIFYNNGTTSLDWLLHTSGGGDGGAACPISTGVWMNITGTYDGAAQIVYKNSALIASVARTGVFTNNTGSGYTVKLGRETEAGGSHNGQFPVAHMYNRALTQAEITQNFNALRGRYGI